MKRFSKIISRTFEFLSKHSGFFATCLAFWAFFFTSLPDKIIEQYNVEIKELRQELIEMRTARSSLAQEIENNNYKLQQIKSNIKERVISTIFQDINDELDEVQNHFLFESRMYEEGRKIIKEHDSSQKNYEESSEYESKKRTRYYLGYRLLAGCFDDCTIEEFESNFRKRIEKKKIVNGQDILMNVFTSNSYISIDSELKDHFQNALNSFIDAHSQDLKLPLEISLDKDEPSENIIYKAAKVEANIKKFRTIIQILLMQLHN